MKTCPACQAAVPNEEAKDCPQCGILFAKWQERLENIEKGNLNRYHQIAAATSSEFNWTILILFCIAVAGLFFFMAQQGVE